MTTAAVLRFDAWTSVLDGLSNTEIFFGPYGFIPYVSLITISTVYFIQNVSLTSSLKNIDYSCVVGEEGR